MSDKANKIDTVLMIKRTELHIGEIQRRSHKQLHIYASLSASALSKASGQSIVENQIHEFHDGEDAAANQQSKVATNITCK